MNPYGASVLLVVFGALLVALDLLLLALTPLVLPRLGRLPPSTRTDAILFVRSLPLLLAAAVTSLAFLPAWWRHEPENTGETVSLLLLAMALISILPILQGLQRAARMFLRTRARLVVWRGLGRSAVMSHTPFEVVEVKSDDLALCVGGYLRPTIYASAEVMKSLDPAELDAALAHEVSHANQRDPLRLLWMGSCPDFLQWFGLDAPWRRAFARACEFAADERAARGCEDVALDLASALVKVARLRTRGALTGDAALEVAVSSAYSSPVDLRARVEALAEPRSSASPAPARLLTGGALAVVVVVAAVGAAVSGHAHGLTESVGRLLAP